MLMLNIAVMSNIEAEASTLDNAYLYNMDMIFIITINNNLV